MPTRKINDNVPNFFIYGTVLHYAGILVLFPAISAMLGAMAGVQLTLKNNE